MTQKIDLSLVLFVMAVIICFIGLTIIVYGVAAEISLFMIGFEIVLCGFTVGFVDVILLLLGIFGKA